MFYCIDGVSESFDKIWFSCTIFDCLGGGLLGLTDSVSDPGMGFPAIWSWAGAKSRDPKSA